MKHPVVCVPILLAAMVACDSPDPNASPEAVGTMPPQEMYILERFTVPDIPGYFSDPDGDTLAYEAAVSNEDLVAVSVSGNTIIGVATRLRGEGTVTVTASDPDGAQAEQQFKVTVLNRAPEPVGTIPQLSLLPNRPDTLDVTPYFRDPDLDTLSYRAESSDEDLVVVSVSGSEVIMESRATRGRTTVTVTASDPAGEEATQRVLVSVYAGPFREDFDSAGSIDAWDMKWLVGSVSDGNLILTDQREPPDDSLPYAGRPTYVAGNWEAETRLFTESGWATHFLVFVDHDDLKAWSFFIDYDFEEWYFSALDGDGWELLLTGSALVSYDEPTNVKIRLVDGVVSCVLKNIPIFMRDLGSMAPDGITGVGLGFHGQDDENTAMFDWVYVAELPADRGK